jgi:hypothetical protein
MCFGRFLIRSFKKVLPKMTAELEVIKRSLSTRDRGGFLLLPWATNTPNYYRPFTEKKSPPLEGEIEPR